jgi:hypothetical protein
MPAKSQYRAILDLWCRFKNESYFVRGVLTKNAHSRSESGFISKWRVACGYYCRRVEPRFTAAIQELNSDGVISRGKMLALQCLRLVFWPLTLGSPGQHLS